MSGTTRSEAQDVLRHYPADPTPWEIGDEVVFSDAVEFMRFEETLPRYIDQTATDAWACRPNIKEQLRPAKFNGRMAGVTLVPISPDRIVNNSWLTIDGRNTYRRINIDAEPLSELTIVFDLFARAMSSGRGQIGTISSTLLYRPRPFSTSSGYRAATGAYPYGIRRHIQKPIISNEIAFDELVKTARSNALLLESAAMLSPITTPMGK